MQLTPDEGSNIARNGMFIALGIITGGYLAVMAHAYRALAISIIGCVANFFDALGIGSFATTTTVVRHFKLVPDEVLPGTLNVGYTIPTVAQAFIFTQIVPVESKTLILMILASVVGAWVGAGVVSAWSRRTIQLSMGVVLLVLAMIAAAAQLKLVPIGGDALGLTGGKLVAGIAGNFILGALMPVGLGLYAPCMILVYMLGMRPTAAFPIMMGSCAFLMPFASVKFVRTGRYARNAVIGMMVGGIPGVLIAAFVVKSLPIDWVKWLVAAVATYAAISLLRSATRDKDIASEATAAEAQPA